MYGQITYELTGGQTLSVYIMQTVQRRAQHTYTSCLVCTYRFDIEEMSGGAQLRTTASLDREAGKTYTMTLIARDGGSPPLADSVEIEVEVVDENDVDPVFSVSEYHFSLFESREYQNFVTFHVSHYIIH